jgi:LPXTG-motif cell wall-anchored protein
MRSFITTVGGLLVVLGLTMIAVPQGTTPTASAAPLLALTETAEPPTTTPVPPTDTPVPPTDTPVPPTDTPMIVADTPVPPTNTAVPTRKPERERKDTATPAPTETSIAVLADPPQSLATETPTAEPPTPAPTEAPSATSMPPARLPRTGEGDGAAWALLTLGASLLAGGSLLRRKPRA